MDILINPRDGMMTADLQNAIDRCFLSGGGRIVLEAGEYLTGGLRLRSNCTLYLRSGAVLKGTRDVAAYRILDGEILEPVNEAYKTDVVWEPPKKRKNADHITRAASAWNNALIRILDAHHVAIIGEAGAVIDGADPYDPVGEEHYRGPHGIAYHHSSDLRFEGQSPRGLRQHLRQGL